MLAYLLYTCNEIVDKVQCIETKRTKKQILLLYKGAGAEKKYIFGNVAFYTFKCYKKRKKEQRNPLFH